MPPLIGHEHVLISLALIIMCVGWRVAGESPLFYATPRRSVTVFLLFLIWQVVMAGLALTGYFAAFDQPWRALPTVGLTMACTLYVATRPGTLNDLRHVPDWTWPAIQSFRLPLELLLYNMYLHIAVLSVPFPFQVFTAEPANRMVASFPFVWLPTFFIPVALFCHIVALRLAFRGTPTAQVMPSRRS